MAADAHEQRTGRTAPPLAGGGSGLLKRLLVGIPLTLLAGGLLVLDGYLARQATEGPGLVSWLRHGAISTALITFFAVLATDELLYLAGHRGYRPFHASALVFSAWLALGPYVLANARGPRGSVSGAVGPDDGWLLFSLAVALIWLFIVQAVRRRTERALESIAVTLVVIFYIGGLAGFMTKLRMEVGGSAGAAALLFSAFLVKITDTGAYFTGRSLGRHKFIAWLSPKKTWEGVAGGLVTTLVLAMLIGRWVYAAGILRFEPGALGVTPALALLGILLGVASVAGDLAESLLKRDAELKDSGRVPGLGGALDMVDSLLLAAPVAWLFWTRLFPVTT